MDLLRVLRARKTLLLGPQAENGERVQEFVDRLDFYFQEVKSKLVERQKSLTLATAQNGNVVQPQKRSHEDAIIHEEHGRKRQKTNHVSEAPIDRKRSREETATHEERGPKRQKTGHVLEAPIDLTEEVEAPSPSLSAAQTPDISPLSAESSQPMADAAAPDTQQRSQKATARLGPKEPLSKLQLVAQRLLAKYTPAQIRSIIVRKQAQFGKESPQSASLSELSVELSKLTADPPVRDAHQRPQHAAESPVPMKAWTKMLREIQSLAYKYTQPQIRAFLISKQAELAQATPQTADLLECSAEVSRILATFPAQVDPTAVPPRQPDLPLGKMPAPKARVEKRPSTSKNRGPPQSGNILQTRQPGQQQSGNIQPAPRNGSHQADMEPPNHGTNGRPDQRPAAYTSIQGFVAGRNDYPGTFAASSRQIYQQNTQGTQTEISQSRPMKPDLDGPRIGARRNQRTGLNVLGPRPVYDEDDEDDAVPQDSQSFAKPARHQSAAQYNPGHSQGTARARQSYDSHNTDDNSGIEQHASQGAKGRWEPSHIDPALLNVDPALQRSEYERLQAHTRKSHQQNVDAGPPNWPSPQRYFSSSDRNSLGFETPEQQQRNKTLLASAQKHGAEAARGRTDMQNPNPPAHPIYGSMYLPQGSNAMQGTLRPPRDSRPSEMRTPQPVMPPPPLPGPRVKLFTSNPFKKGPFK